jgi:hypothetical protein
MCSRLCGRSSRHLRSRMTYDVAWKPLWLLTLTLKHSSWTSNQVLVGHMTWRRSHSLRGNQNRFDHFLLSSIAVFGTPISDGPIDAG